jgi:hypothetical protein
MPCWCGLGVVWRSCLSWQDTSGLAILSEDAKRRSFAPGRQVAGKRSRRPRVRLRRPAFRQGSNQRETIELRGARRRGKRFRLLELGASESYTR